MKCDTAALKNHADLCKTRLDLLKSTAQKDLPEEAANDVCAVIEEMQKENLQLLLVLAEYEKAIKKAECYVQSVRLE